MTGLGKDFVDDIKSTESLVSRTDEELIELNKKTINLG